MADNAVRRAAPVAVVAVVATTAVWGSTFGLSKDLLTRLPVTDYLALRFLAAALFLGLARPRVVASLDRRVLVRGVALGTFYFAGQFLQFVGLQRTPATVSAFVVSMYVVFAPVVAGVVTRTRPGARTVVASLVAAAGVAAMSLRGFEVGVGQALTLVSALLYAVHIVALGHWTSVRSAYALTFVQLVTMGVCFLGAAAWDGLTLPSGHDWFAFLYLATVAGGLTMLVQTWAQAHLSAARTAVLMVLEPVWAAAFGIALWGEQLEVRVLLGAALVLVGLLVVTTGRRAGPEAPPGAGEPVPLQVAQSAQLSGPPRRRRALRRRRPRPLRTPTPGAVHHDQC